MPLRLSLVLALACAAALGMPAQAGELATSTVRLMPPGETWGADAPAAGAHAVLPGWLRWALTPRLQSGGTSGAVGLPDPTYRGLAWTMPLASGVLQQDDRLTIGFTLGNGFAGSFASDPGRDPRSQLPTPTTRLGAAIGYQITPRIGLYVLFDHVSVTGLSRDDQIANDLGMQMGVRF